MNSVHGVIASAGNGTRFAESVGATWPYPKHLEMVNGQTVLEHALVGITQNIGVESVTFTLNPSLAAEYYLHITELQKRHRGIKLSIATTKVTEEGNLFANIRNTLSQDVYGVDGARFDLHTPIIAIALGDSIITGDGTDALRDDVRDHYGEILEGKTFGVFRDGQKGLLYWVSNFYSLGDGKADVSRDGRDYGFKFWNCNTREELIRARIEMTHPSVVLEGMRHGRKESYL